MEFEYYNPSNDKRSCVVRTMTKLTGKEYSAVKSELTELAKDIGCETYNDEKVFSRYMADHGIYKLNDYADTKVGQLIISCGHTAFTARTGTAFIIFCQLWTT